MSEQPVSAELQGLQQECVRPGFWKIGGYDVHRNGTRYDTFWDLWQYGVRVHVADSLNDARDWVAKQGRVMPS